MEFGAVKQAFNNELIFLKKKMNQAKIQTIHKLTRKAKTLSQKKAPDHLKDKLQRKVESAVKEVLIIKKLVPKELARFAITHKGNLNDFLNKPNVDSDKACARLLLHKSLQDKYQLLRIRFSSIPIEDLLMSREERRKLKKEEREKRKEKKNKDKVKENIKKKCEVVNAEGEWDVEEIPDTITLIENCEESDIETKPSKSQSESEDEDQSETVEDMPSNDEESEENKASDVETSHDSGSDSNHPNNTKENTDYKKSPRDIGKFVRLQITNKENDGDDKEDNNVSDRNKISQSNMLLKQETRKGIEKKVTSKPGKNKNLNEKLKSRKFKKDIYENVPAEAQTKVVDPFFITSTGENYMSVAEPRAPDEVKEVHQQGNRKLRRAAMFGHIPNIKPRRDFGFDNNRFGGQHRVDGHNSTNTFNNNTMQDNTNNRNSINKIKQFSKEEPDVPAKPEKLHPSWEAKKRQSGLLPFQGKKIVFDEI